MSRAYVEVRIMPRAKPHSAQFKFKAALEAIKENKTLNELASEYGLLPSQISATRPFSVGLPHPGGIRGAVAPPANHGSGHELKLPEKVQSWGFSEILNPTR
jgi:hypothetical protein